MYVCMYVCMCMCMYTRAGGSRIRVWLQMCRCLVSGVWEVTPATGVSTTTHQLHNTVLATTSNSWDMRFKGENRKTCDGLDSGAGLGENRMGTCTDTLSPPGIMLHPQFSSWMEISNLDEISISSSYSILITVHDHETAPVICYLR